MLLRKKERPYQRAKYWLADHLLTALLTFAVPLFRWIPLRGIDWLSRILGTVAYHVCGKYRNRVFRNLLLAFGTKSDLKPLQRLAKEIFYHFTLTPLETIFLAANGIPLERFILKIRLEGKENLETALARGKGVVALGAHFGSFTLLGTRLAVEGYPLSILVNVGRYPRLWQRLSRYQELVGQQIISVRPTSVSIKKCLNCLHRNEILYILADQRQRHGALPVPFFGETAYTPLGPAIFSLKTGAPILPMYVKRDDEGTRTLVIKSPLPFRPTESEQRDIERLTHQFTQVIEEIVKNYPSQWPWLNKRWKSSCR